MRAFLIRNDDVAYDTDLGSLKKFCEICDKYGFKIIQAIVPIGEHRKANCKMENCDIWASSQMTLAQNDELLAYLKSRKDLYGVHGLWHTHEPSTMDILVGKGLLTYWGLRPSYFVPPFNEGDYPDEVAGLRTCKLDMAKGERLEDFLKEGTPTAPIMYCHSWRFGKWYRWSSLDRCLERLIS